MSLKKGEIESQLLNKFGFEDRSSGRGSHQKLVFIHNGKQVATTYFSRGFRKNTDIDNTLLMLMARQSGVMTVSFFKKMITCTRSKEDYIQRLDEQGHLD